MTNCVNKSQGVYSDYNDFITSEANDSVGAVIILLLNAFEQSAIFTVSYVICKASIVCTTSDTLLSLLYSKTVHYLY